MAKHRLDFITSGDRRHLNRDDADISTAAVLDDAVKTGGLASKGARGKGNIAAVNDEAEREAVHQKALAFRREKGNKALADILDSLGVSSLTDALDDPKTRRRLDTALGDVKGGMKSTAHEAQRAAGVSDFGDGRIDTDQIYAQWNRPRG
jgi:hypothetical protein